jgi:hypothetical protein
MIPSFSLFHIRLIFAIIDDWDCSKGNAMGLARGVVHCLESDQNSASEVFHNQTAFFVTSNLDPRHQTRTMEACAFAPQNHPAYRTLDRKNDRLCTENLQNTPLLVQLTDFLCSFSCCYLRRCNQHIFGIVLWTEYAHGRRSSNGVHRIRPNSRSGHESLWTLLPSPIVHA